MKKNIFIIIIIIQFLNILTVYANPYPVQPVVTDYPYYITYYESGFYYTTYYNKPNPLYKDGQYLRSTGNGMEKQYSYNAPNWTYNQDKILYLDTISIVLDWVVIKEANFIIEGYYTPPGYHDYYIDNTANILNENDITNLKDTILKFERNRQIQVFIDTYENDISDINDFTILKAQQKVMGNNSAGIIQIIITPNQRSILFSNYALTSFAGTKYYLRAERFLDKNDICSALETLYNETNSFPIETLTQIGTGPLFFKRTNFNYNFSSSLAIDDKKIVSRIDDQTLGYSLKQKPLDDYMFYDAVLNGGYFDDFGLDNYDSVLTPDSSGSDYYSKKYNMYARVWSKGEAVVYTPNPTGLIYTPLPSPIQTNPVQPTLKPQIPDDFDKKIDEKINDEIFDETFALLYSLEDLDNKPSFKLNLRKLTETVTQDESQLLNFEDEEIEYIDFTIFDTKMIFGMTIIEFFRRLISACVVIITIIGIKRLVQSTFSPAN